MKKRENSITEGPIFLNLFLFTVPIILTGLLQLLYNAADVIVVGRFAGSNSLAAVGSTSSLTHLFLNIFIGLSSGSAVCVAHFIGAREKEGVTRAVHTSIGIAAIGGIVVAIVGVIFAKNFLAMMDTPADIIDEAALYLKIIFVGMPASLIYNFGAAILRAKGNTKTPLIILSATGIVNVILNLIFVIAFKMGAEGVGIATIVSQFLSAVIIIKHLMGLEDECKLILKKVRIYKNILIRILKIGLPAGIQGIIFSISNILIQSSINGFGSATVAGNSASSNIESFSYVAMNAMHQAVTTYVGQNVGANKIERVKKIIITACVQVSAIGIVLSGLLLLFAHPLLSLYVPGDEEVIALGALRMKYILSTYFICGIMDTLVGALRGMGTSFLPMLASVFGVCVLRVVWIFTVFEKYQTLHSIYISYPISWLITTLIQAVLTAIVVRSLAKNIIE